MVVFRSLLVPLKAVIMNLLSIGAAYGVVVALFQWGWLSDLTGVQPGPIEPWVPMMLFAIVFGLSMDYEVFLLSRIREEWHRTGDSRTLGRRRPRRHRQGHHRRRRDHGRRLRQLPARERPVDEADGHRPGHGDPPRRHHRPHAARARHDGAARRQELVAAPLARPASCPTSTSRATPSPSSTTKKPSANLSGRASAEPAPSSSSTLTKEQAWDSSAAWPAPLSSRAPQPR